MANQHGPKSEYYTSMLSFNKDAVPKGKLLNAAQALGELQRDVQNLINVYVTKGTFKRILDGNDWELFSADKNALDSILSDLKRELDEIERDCRLKGVFSLSKSSSKKYDVFKGEFFGEARKLKAMTVMINALGGRIVADGRIQKIELPQGAINPITGAQAIGSIRSTFGNELKNIKKFLVSKGIDWDAYRTGDDVERKALMNQAVQIERNEIAARPDIAQRRYSSKEQVARANADATSRRIDEIIANGEEPILPATDVAKLPPRDKSRWTAYRKHWETKTFDPVMMEMGAYDKLNKDEREKRAYEKAKERFIAANPNSQLAVNETLKRQNIAERAKKLQQQKRAMRGRKIKSAVSGAARLARNVVAVTIGAILTGITMGVSLLTKSFQVISQIGSDVRKRAISEAKYNFAPDTIRQFEIFANQHAGLRDQKDLLVRAAGGIHTAWSTPLNYAESGFKLLAPYLREGTVKLVSMATADGDANVLNIMSAVIDDLVEKSLSGISGAKLFDPTLLSGQRSAFSGNLTALSQHNEAWGELMNQYWHDYLKSRASSIGTWKKEDRSGVMRTMTFENWVTQGAWSKEFMNDTGISSPVIRDAAEETYGLVTNFVGTFSTLGTDIATAISGSMGGVVEWLRQIVNNWLAPYFPAFAMKEDQRAVYLNMQSKALAQNLLPEYESDAKRALLDINYDYGLSQFEKVLEAIGKGDVSQIPYYVDIKKLKANMGVFKRYYDTEGIITKVDEQNRKADEAVKAGRTYVREYIPATVSSIITTANTGAMVLQHQLDDGMINARIRPVGEDMQFELLDFLAQVGIGVVNIPNAAARGVDAILPDIEPRSRRLTNDLEQLKKKLEWYKKEHPKDASLKVLKDYYDRMETTLRDLVTAYDEEGQKEIALFELDQLYKFYSDYPEELEKYKDPRELQEINEQIAKDTEWLWYGDNFAKVTRVLHHSQLAALTYAQFKRNKAQFLYAQNHTGMAERAVEQERLNHEAVVAGMMGTINGQILKEIPSIENVRNWISADIGNIVHLDTFDEETNSSMSDIVVNLISNGRVIHTIRTPNTYGQFKRDVILDKTSGSFIQSVMDAQEAPIRTPLGKTE